MKQYNIKINGNAYNVQIDSIDANGVAQVTVNGKAQTVQIEGAAIPAAALASVPVAAPVQAPAAAAAPAAAPVSAPAAAPAAGGSDVCSPLPGVIIGISAKVGDKVAVGDTIATLEAMKMENAIEAEKAGTITAIYVTKGDSVLEGAKIATIA